jgi:hypothetical protein
VACKWQCVGDTMKFNSTDHTTRSEYNTNHHKPAPGQVRRHANDASDIHSLDSRDQGHASQYESLESALDLDDEVPMSEFSKSQGGRRASVSNLRHALAEMKAQMLMLEKRISSTSRVGDVIGGSEILSQRDSVRSTNVTFANGIAEGSDTTPMLAECREKTWYNFQNKQETNEGECAIEILLGEPDYRPSSKEIDKTKKKAAEERFFKIKASSHTIPAPTPRTDGILPVPERIRINSPLILSTLASIDDTIDIMGPVVMLRPFKFLLYHETQIKDAVHELRDRLDTMLAIPDDVTAQAPTRTATLPAETDDFSIPRNDSEELKSTIEHMRCLCDFIDKYLLPINDHLDKSTASKISFENLWYLFRTGEDIFMPLRSLRKKKVTVDAIATAPETFQSRYNMIWRVIGTGGGRPNIATAKNRNASLRPNPFVVNCYYIDFDGKYFCPIIHTFTIMPFKGEKSINNLDFYPIRFMETDYQSMRENLNKGTTTFASITRSYTHFYYSGPTLTVQPCGCELGKEPVHQENVESEVIVDFRMSLLKHPSWRPKAPIWKHPPMEPRELQENVPVRVLKGNQIIDSDRDHVYDDYHIERELSIAIRNKERIFSPVPSGWTSNESMVPEEDVMLLTSRVFAFVLRTRTFGKNPSYRSLS